MHSKSILIAVAALALTATGAQAFSGEALVRAGLTARQRGAFSEARALRRGGNPDAARDILLEAGIDEVTIEKIRRSSTTSDKKSGHSPAMTVALDANNYRAFLAAIQGIPLADIVTTQADFNRYKAAYDLHAGA